jgi:hypothetical protein
MGGCAHTPPRTPLRPDALFPPQEVSTWISWKRTSTGTNIARRLWDQREELRGEYEDVHGTDPALWPVQHPGVVLDAVPSTAHGACLGCQCWMCEVIGWATPTGSNEPLCGRTDTKSPMVYSSMVHVAGGEGGSTRHDDDGRPAPLGGSPVSEGRWVHDDQVATMIDMNRLRDRTAELGFMPATTDEAAGR